MTYIVSSGTLLQPTYDKFKKPPVVLRLIVRYFVNRAETTDQ